jgi:hypothetical protein
VQSGRVVFVDLELGRDALLVDEHLMAQRQRAAPLRVVAGLAHLDHELAPRA